MVYNEYTQLRILQLNGQGIRLPSIAKYLAVEGIAVSKRGIAKFLKRFFASGKLANCSSSFMLITTLVAEGTLARRPESGRKSVITYEVQRIVEEQTRCDDEITAS